MQGLNRTKPRASCPHCGYAGKARLRPAWLAWLAIAVWLIPLGFLLAGLWPFFILPSIAITVAAILAVRPACAQCGRPLRKPDG
jgi:hypothetical protein